MPWLESKTLGSQWHHLGFLRGVGGHQVTCGVFHPMIEAGGGGQPTQPLAAPVPTLAS